MPPEGEVYVQSHDDCEHCGGGWQVLSQPDRNIELLHHGQVKLSLIVRGDERPWLPDALRRAWEHATGKRLGSEYIVLDDQQAAALFRGGTWACQFEGGRMRWWLDRGLRIELHEGEWRLFVKPTRDTSAFNETESS